MISSGYDRRNLMGMPKRKSRSIDTTPVTTLRLVPRDQRDACVAALVSKNYFGHREEVFDHRARVVFMLAS